MTKTTTPGTTTATATMSSTTAKTTRILKIATCPSLTNRSTLTYHVGCNTQGEVLLRIWNNSSSGYFNKDWISMQAIHDAIDRRPAESRISSTTLHALLPGRSANTAGFLMAALKHEGLVQLMSEIDRYYECSDPSGFFAEVQALIDAGIDLAPDDKPKGVAKGASKRATRKTAA